MKSLGRRKFLELLPVLAGIAVIWLWKKPVSRDVDIQKKRRRIYYPEGADPFYASPGVLFFRDKAGIRAYSSRCTHMGCIVSQQPDGRVVCPCHGSEFTHEGKVLRGPAIKDLREFPVKYDTIKNLYYVDEDEQD